MHLRPTITLEQYAAIISAVESRRAKAKIPKWRGILIALVLGTILGFLIVFPRTHVAALTFFCSYLAYFLFCKWFVPRRKIAFLRTLYDDMKDVLQNNEMEVDPSGISGTFKQGQAAYRYRWQTFTDHLDRPDEYLFFYAPACWVRIPKQDLSPTEQQQILSWYQASKVSTQ